MTQRLMAQQPLNEGLARVTVAAWMGDEAVRADSYRGESIRLRVGNQYTVSVVPDNNFPWPLPLERSDLAVLLVLQEWVEDEPSVTIRQLLDEQPAWHEAMAAAKAYHRKAQAQGVIWRGAIREGRTHELASRPSYWHALDGDLCRLILIDHGLPANPRIARYLLSLVNPRMYDLLYDLSKTARPLPARAVLVTSACLVRCTSAVYEPVDLVSTLDVSARWTASPLVRRANTVITKHQNFWRKLCQGKRADLRVGNGRPADYEELAAQYSCGIVTARAAWLRAMEIRRSQQAVVLVPADEAAVRRALRKQMDRVNAALWDQFNDELLQ